MTPGDEKGLTVSDGIVGLNRRTEVRVKPCDDSDERARHNQTILDIARDAAAALGRETINFLAAGGYHAPSGHWVDLRDAVAQSLAGKASLPPDAPLPNPPLPHSPRLTVQVRNETTLAAALSLAGGDGRVLALNFAAPTHPGGGFLSGARAQEEVLARSSGLYATLDGDPMYAHHERHYERHYDPMATDWAILSPDVPVFRTDDGALLDEPWLCTMLTCAAPQAKRVTVGDPKAAMRGRISRVLAIARAYGYDTLVLGAWGCGAFGNDPVAVAGFFREGLLGPFLGAFSQVVFAITDWSPERRFLAPFRDEFTRTSR